MSTGGEKRSLLHCPYLPAAAYLNQFFELSPTADLNPLALWTYLKRCCSVFLPYMALSVGLVSTMNRMGLELKAELANSA